MALASAPRDGITQRASRPLPAVHRIAGLPFAEQRKDWCGPAVLAAVLSYHGEKVAAADIARDIYLPGYRGALNLDLFLWAKKRGLAAWAGAGSEERIRQEVGRDRPVICMVRRRGRLADRNHFVILRGYDRPRQLWLVDNGTGKEEQVRFADFDHNWRECGRWMLVVQGGSPSPQPEAQRAPG